MSKYQPKKKMEFSHTFEHVDKIEEHADTFETFKLDKSKYSPKHHFSPKKTVVVHEEANHDICDTRIADL